MERLSGLRSNPSRPGRDVAQAVRQAGLFPRIVRRQGVRPGIGGSNLITSALWSDGPEASTSNSAYPDDVTGCKVEANWR
jgi:hypothetical protein